MSNFWLIAATIMVLLLTFGCKSAEPVRHIVDPVEVQIPVLERAAAPEELIRPKITAEQLPLWIAPTDPSATVCTNRAGESKLKAIVLRDEALLFGWETYAR